MAKIYVGDVGTIFRIDTGVALTAFTTHDINIRKPDSTVVTWVGTVNGTDNTLIDYIAVTGDLDQAGTYTGQAVGIEPGWSGRGDTFHFVVTDIWK